MEYQNWSLLWGEPILRNNEETKQLVSRVVALRESKKWKAGMLMPPQELVAGKLGLSKATVHHAYNILKKAKQIDATPRIGARIAGRMEKFPLNFHLNPPFVYGDGPLPTFPTDIERGNAIDLGMEYPLLSDLKLNTYIKGFSDCVSKINVNNLSEAECHKLCLDQLQVLLAHRRIHVSADQLALVPEGRVLEVVAECLSLQGEHVLMDDVYDRVAFHAFRKAGATVHFTGTVDGTMDLSVVEHYCETLNPSCLFVRSAASAWEGRNLSVNDRVTLLDLSRKYHFTIVCLHERFDLSMKKPYYPLLLHEGADRVVYISPLSNINALTRNLAVVVIYRKFVQEVKGAMSASGIRMDAVIGYALCRLVAEGRLDREIVALLRQYRDRAEAIGVAFRTRLGDYATWRHADAGFVSILKLHEEISLGSLLPRLAELGVYDQLQNQLFDPEKPLKAIRIGYAGHDEKVWGQVFDAIAERIGA